MRKLFRYLRNLRFRYQPLIAVRVYKERLLHNLRIFQQKAPRCKVAPVLKSNAYGHGLIPIAKVLDKEDIAFLVVDSYFEALMLRNEEVKSNILIIGFTTQENIYASTLRNAAFAIISLNELRELSHGLKSKRRFHLKIDIGLHRQGILSNEIEEAIALIQNNSNIILEGACSHFADAGNPDTSFTFKQIKQWNEIVARLKKTFPAIEYYHLAATAGTAYADKIDANVSRVGRGLYGFTVGPVRELDLQPVLEMQSIITSVKTIGPGEGIGYGLTYKTTRHTKIATVPVGYFEGVDRRLSNIGFLKCKGVFCQIIGMVTMNITTIDVSNVPEVKIGDPVSIISIYREDKNSADNMAELCHTLPYEILVHIPQHLRRTVV